jgi:hypothetical protein
VARNRIGYYEPTLIPNARLADYTAKWQDDYQRLLQEFRELLSRHLAIAEDLVEEARPYRLA